MFDVVTARDFYAMLIEDFDDFMEEPHSARRALHCAISAYHLHEWIWSDWLKNDVNTRQKLGIKKNKDDFVAWLLRANVWFFYVQAIANGTKHFGRSEEFGTIKVSAPPLAFDQLTAGFDQGAWDGPVRYGSGSLPVGPKGKGYLILDLGKDAGEHRWLPMAHLLEVVVRFWRDFFRFYGPTENVLASRHHAS